MPKTRASKVATVERLVERLKSAKGVVLADFTGLVIKEIQDLRAEFRKAGMTYEVVKKSLLSRALKEAGFSSVPADQFTSSVSVGASVTDEIEPAKVSAAFAKGHEKLHVLGGIVEQRYHDATAMRDLATLPGKQELRARLVGSLNSPLVGLVNVLQGNLRGFVQVLRAMADKPQV